MALLFLSLEADAGPLLLQMDQQVSGEGPSQVILGYDTIGGSSGNFSGQCNPYTNSGDTFTLTKGYFYTTSTHDFRMSVWPDAEFPSGTDACSTLNDLGDTGWRSVNFDGANQITISNGSTYWICYFSNNANTTRFFDTTSPPTAYYAYDVSNVCAEQDWRVSGTARRYSMYISNQ